MATNDNQKNDRQDEQGRSARGFASMDEDKQREIASKGGKAAHQKGTAHEFDSESGRAAGRVGGSSRGDMTSDADDMNDIDG
jgi:general stress protein YciG